MPYGFGSASGGATGADDYYSRRLATVARYQAGAGGDFDTAYNLAVSDVDMNGGVRSLGARPSNAYTMGEMISYMQSHDRPVIPVEDIRAVKQQLKAEGWVHPDMPITDYWGPDDPFMAAYDSRTDYLREHPGARAQPGTVAPKGIFKLIGDITPSGIWKGIVGLAKSTGADVGKTLGITQLANLDPQYKEEQTAREDHNKAVEAKVEAAGGWDGDKARGYTWRQYYEDNWQLYGESKEEVFGPLEKLPAGALSLDAPLTRDYDAGWDWTVTHPDDAVWATINTALLVAGGGPEASVGRKAAQESVGNLARTLANDGLRAALKVVPSEVERGILNRTTNKLVSWSTGKLGWEEAGSLYSRVTEVLPKFKSTALGQAVTGVYTGAAKASVAARAIGAVESGEWLPGAVNPLDLPQSSLAAMIDNAPVLGQHIAFGPVGEGRALGNALDLTGFVWNPTSFLPVTFGQIKGGVTNLVGRNELAPLQQLFKVGREELINRWGGQERAARIMRYLKLQAAVDKRVAERVPDFSEPGVATKGRWAIGEEIATGGPVAVEEAIQSVEPGDVARTALRVFGDPGAGDPIAWGRAHDILDGVGMNDVSVHDFRSWSGRKTGGGIWSKANVDALADTADELAARVPGAEETAALAAAGEGVPGAGAKVSAEMRQGMRLAEALTGEEKLVFTRADKPLSSAQSLSAWHGLTRRLDELSAIAPLEDGSLRFVRKVPQIADLRAAGFTDAEVAGMKLRAGEQGTEGMILSAEEAGRLQGSLDGRIGELTTKFLANHPEFESRLSNGRLVFDRGTNGAIRQLALEAPRAVTIGDESAVRGLAELGYEPAVAHKGTLTLRDVGTADMVEELGVASKWQGVMDWMGMSERPITKKVLGTLQRNHLESELGSVLDTSHNLGAVGTAVDGPAALRQLRDVAKEAEKRRSGVSFAGRKIWRSGEIFDMRSLSVKELVDSGGMDERGARLVQSAVRRAMAFGTVADIAHPLQSVKGLADMFKLRGIPGAEDFLRTLGRTGTTDAAFQDKGPLGSLLRLPDHLVRARDFSQFALSPLFTLGEVVESSGMRALKGIPRQMPWKAEETLNILKQGDPQDFERVMAEVFGDRAGPGLAARVGDDLDLLGMRGFFGVNMRASEMLDGYRLRVAGKSVDEVRSTLESVYHYGNRSPLELTANYVFFPLSFQKKVGSALLGWFNQAPARALGVTVPLAMYNKMDEQGKITDFRERYLPILHQLNKLNIFNYGLGATTGPLGGKNKRLTDATKALASLVSGNKGEPALGAFLPVAVSAQDRKDAASTMKRLIPAYGQITSFWDDLTSQTHAITEGGSDDWQVSNYFDDKHALDEEIRQDMFGLGLTGGRQSLSAKKVGADYRTWVQQRDDALAAKYPRGKTFADRYIADAVVKSNELVELANKRYHTPSENAMLTYAAMVAQEEGDAALAARRVALSPSQRRRYALEVSASAQKGLPVPDLPGELSTPQKLALRMAAHNLSTQYPDFQYMYDRYFRDDFGPITLERMEQTA